MVRIENLVGKTLREVTGASKYSDAVTFVVDGGPSIKMWHRQDCCESVSLEDVIGDVDDLVGTPIVRAEEVSSTDGVDTSKAWSEDPYPESFSWTFYIVATAKGAVTFRWYGASNGYYSEGVDFTEVTTGFENKWGV